MSESDDDRIRVCLLVDGETIAEWQHAALEQMVQETKAEITTVVSNRETGRSRIGLLRRAVELREWAFVWLLRSTFAASYPLTDVVALVDRDYLADADWHHCTPKTVDGWKSELPGSVVDAVTDDADVAVRFGFGFLVGDILTELEYGVLSFHHGDLREYRGQPAGCWEYIHGEESVGITLQRITEDLDAGEVGVTKTVSIADANTYAEIRGRLYEASKDVLAIAIGRLEAGDTEWERVSDLGPVYTHPRGGAAFRFLLKEIRGHLREVME